ncbi:inorganic phosphate transporter [Sphingobacterium sp. SGR-19]|uniref:inorganic phosphate transporter n=1 Tax=Sphingobacterium sp. SGR-19 TaxID=2710886 RepID=UPI0013EAFD1C|nr:inorganic phosphate transporter [Sphingobacterium sp. SGR-19]NGM63720.1 inorganic phosphate transporter [Sphingobacterium sp. SGR-19]
MDWFLFLVVVLLILAIGDLIVGVSNDAVNFLNSAIGSRVASFRTIITLAALGILIGAFFSSGMMEIARKGIFHPEYFTFDKVLWIFLAVMLTDIVLLDIFNTLGLPTSTTVSIVFELLGAAWMVGLLLTIEKNEPISASLQYINIESTFSIVSGIFLSIFIAFTAGILIQYLCRMVFSFQYKTRLAQFGAPFSGLGITSIVYFLLIKGMSGTTLSDSGFISWILDNTLVVLLGIFVFFTLLCIVLQRFFRINPLKIVVLAGTFSLAMAFAGNDLVNFIGVPISGLMAYQNWIGSGIAADQFYQTFLASSDIIVPPYMLAIAGLVMAGTIWLSSKARKVTETEVNLGSHNDEEDDKFTPNAVSRSVVRTSFLLGNIFSAFVPRNIKRRYDISFEKEKLRQATQVAGDAPAFDLVRASTNLILASLLIAWATSKKLPLSTTYVTFMVAMGTSLADKAWGRESAVYRVTGVLSVVGGWFITALIAFSVSAIFALIIYKGGIAGALILMGVVVTYVIISHISFAKKEKKAQSERSKLSLLDVEDLDVYIRSKKMAISFLIDLAQMYNQILNGISNNDVHLLKKASMELKELNKYTTKLKRKSLRAIRELNTVDQKTSGVVVHSTDLLQDLIQSANSLSTESLQYFENLHQPLHPKFTSIVDTLNVMMHGFFEQITEELNKDQGPDIDKLRARRNQIRDYINVNFENQLNIIRRDNTGSKQALLQTGMFLQSRDIQAVLFRISKLYARFENN